MDDEFTILNLQNLDNPQPVSEPSPATGVVETAIIATEPSSNFLIEESKKANLAINPEQEKILTSFISKTSVGHQSVLPLKCKGQRCPFIDICPLAQAKMQLPVDKACPVENALISTWANTTMQALNIDPTLPENAIDVNMAFELAGLEMIRYRAAFHMHKEPELVETRIVGYSPQGQPIYDEKPKMAVLIMERISKSISKLRDQLLATRRSQAQVGKLASDASVRGANMIAKAKAIADKRRSGGNITDVDFKVLDGPEKQGSDQVKPTEK